MEQKVTPIEIKQNMVELEDLNSNVTKQYAYNLTEGSYSVSFRPSNFWWLDLIFGAPSVAGTGPYTYTYAANGVIPKTVTSFASELGSALETANVVRNPLGNIIDTARLEARVGELCQGSISVKYAKELAPTTTLNSSPPTDSLLYPFSFVQAAIQIPDGTPIAEVQSFELTFNPNQKILPGMNNQYGVSAWRGKTSITGRFNVTAKDASLLNNVLNRTEGATLTIILDNGLAGTSQKTMKMPFVGVGYDSHSTGHTPNELILEDLPLVLRQPANAGLVFTNNVSSAP